MSKTDEDIKRIRESAMKKLADALNEKLTEKYELGDGDLSISMFGSQTLLSDFDMHIFVKNRLLTDPQTGKDKTDELNSELESLVDQYFKTSFDKTLDEYKKNVRAKKIKEPLPEHILEVMGNYDPKLKKGICDFYVGSLEELMDQEKIPIGKPSDKDDYRRGYRGRAPNVKLKFIAKTQKHLSGLDVSEHIEKGAANAKLHPSEGYEKYIIETRNIAYGFLNKDGRSISKSLVEIAHAISIIGGEGILVSHDEKIRMGKRFLGYFLQSTHYRKIINDAFDVKKGLNENLEIKQEFDWNSLEQTVDVFLEDGTKSKVTGIDCLWSMFDYLSRLFKKTVYETGYIEDQELKTKISGYLNETSGGLIKAIIEAKRTNNEVDQRFMLFYINELISSGYSTADPNFKELLKDLNSSITPDSLTNALTKARLELALSDYSSAKNTFTKLLEKDEKTNKCGIEELIKVKPWTLAYSYSDLEPDIIISGVYKDFSKALLGLNELGGAKKSLAEAIKLNPLNHELWTDLANIHRRQNETKLAEEYETISQQLEHNDYNVFEWQKFKGEEIKNLFKYWKNNFEKTFKKYERTVMYTEGKATGAVTKGEQISEMGAILGEIIDDYNRAYELGWNVSIACNAGIGQISIVNDFIRDGLAPLALLTSIQEKINPSAAVEYASGNIIDTEKGMFPLYKKAMDVFFKQKLVKESRLMELDFVISDAKKSHMSLLKEIKDTGGSGEALRQLLEHGFVGGATYKTFWSIYKESTEYKKDQDPIETEYQNVDTKLKTKLSEIRRNLEEQLESYECLPTNINRLHKLGLSSFVVTCTNCGSPVFSAWDNCKKCNNNEGLKSIGHHVRKLSKKFDLTKDDILLNENGSIKADYFEGYSQVYLKNIPDELKEGVAKDTIVFGVLDLGYQTKAESEVWGSNYCSTGTGIKKAICRAYLKREVKDDAVSSGYVLCLTQKIPKIEEIESIQIFVPELKGGARSGTS